MGYYMALNAHKIVDPQALDTEKDSAQPQPETLQLTDAEKAELNEA